MTAMQPQVDVLWTDLDATVGGLPRWYEMLSTAERGRAGRFRYARDRDRYVARRGILRTLLGRRLGQAPEALRFTSNEYGKPALADGGCEFNLSHSRGLALFAFCRDVPIGCDVEYHDARFLAEKIPERLFSTIEIRELRAFTPEQQTAAFFDGWTRKEAFIKARGLGLALPLDSFDVSMAPGDRPALYRGCAGWSARDIKPAPQCSAAVIAQSTDWRMDAQPLDVLTLLTEISAAF
jgi:4'-phosphopantetheinyl transferase